MKKMGKIFVLSAVFLFLFLINHGLALAADPCPAAYYTDGVISQKCTLAELFSSTDNGSSCEHTYYQNGQEMTANYFCCDGQSEKLYSEDRVHYECANFPDCSNETQDLNDCNSGFLSNAYRCRRGINSYYCCNSGLYLTNGLCCPAGQVGNNGSCSTLTQPDTDTDDTTSPGFENKDAFNPLTKTKLNELNPLAVMKSDQAETLSTPGGILSRVLDFAFPLAGFILFVMIVWGGFEMIKGATAKKMDAGKQRITAAIMGFIMLFISYWLIQVVFTILGVKQSIFG